MEIHNQLHINDDYKSKTNNFELIQTTLTSDELNIGGEESCSLFVSFPSLFHIIFKLFQ